MKTAVSEYGFINAKLRSKISMLLTEEFKNSLLKSDNIEEAAAVLEQFNYDSLVRVWNSTADIQSIEFELFKYLISAYRLIMKNTFDGLNEIINLLSIKPEIENIKTAVRLWYGSTVRGRPIGHRTAYIYKERIFEAIDWIRLLNASDYQEISEIFRNTIYSEVFFSHDSIDKDSGIFDLEISLDKLYYKLLLENTSRIRSSDRKILNEIITTEIDLQNVSWIIRYYHFYKYSPEKLSRILIPGGSYINLNTLEYSESSSAERINPFDFLKKTYPELSGISLADKHDFSSQAVFFEQLLNETRKNRFTKLLRGYPFTIGIILVYLFMVEREIKFISTVLNGKLYNIGSQRLGEISL